METKSLKEREVESARKSKLDGTCSALVDAPLWNSLDKLLTRKDDCDNDFAVDV